MDSAPIVIAGSAYLILLLIGAIIAIAIAVAPLKLYAIHKELKWQSQEMRTQTKLLAELANQGACEHGEIPTAGG